MTANARRMLLTCLALLPCLGCGTAAYEERVEQTINEQRMKAVHGDQAPAEESGQPQPEGKAAPGEQPAADEPAAEATPGEEGPANP